MILSIDLILNIGYRLDIKYKSGGNDLMRWTKFIILQNCLEIYKLYLVI